MVGSFRAAGENKMFDLTDCTLCHLVHFPEFSAMMPQSSAGLNINACMCTFLPEYLFMFIPVASIQGSPCVNLFYEVFSEALWPSCPPLHFFIPKL